MRKFLAVAAALAAFAFAGCGGGDPNDESDAQLEQVNAALEAAAYEEIARSTNCSQLELALDISPMVAGAARDRMREIGC